MKKFLFFAAAVAALVTSCNKEQATQDFEEVSTVYATFAQDNATKVVMGESDGTNTPLNWNQGDKIVVVNINGSPENPENLTHGMYQTASSVKDGDSRAKFDFKGGTQIDLSVPHFAVYPYERIFQDTHAFAYKSEQAYKENSFDPAQMPLVAKNESGNIFTFNAQAAVVRLKVSTTTSDVKVTSIELSSATRVLTGYADPDIETATYGVPVRETGKTTTLVCPAGGVAINGTAKEFNIVVPGQTYPSGDLTITVRTNKGNIVKTSKAEATFAAGKVYNLNISGEPVANTPDPGIFTLTASGDKVTLRINHSGLQYQTINQDWSPYTAYTWITLEDGQFIQFKAADDASHTRIYTSSFEIYGPVDASGSVMTLLPDGTEMGINAFKELFKNCTGLKTAPELPAETMKSSCYESMFEGCTSLETAPTLPAETLGNYCYRYMFKGCTSLETAPELPATSMKQRCYESMFEGCTSLETAPELPATSLVNHCYTYMFKGCSNLCEIHVSFTEWGNATTGWVDGVFYDGRFYCPESLASESTRPFGINQVPQGWSIYN